MMRCSTKYLRRMLAGVIGILAGVSCVREAAPGETSRTNLELQVRPLTRGVQDNGGVAEKIRSLRIVVLGSMPEASEKYFVEYNRKFEYAPEAAADFSRIVTMNVRKGTKKIFFFANEESVGGLPELLGGAAWQAPERDPETGEVTGAIVPTEFEETVNGFSFEPDYRVEEDGAVYLPYSAYYGDIEIPSDAESESVRLAPMYLVPVATKFFFSFTNYHAFAVSILRLDIQNTDSRNYLLGQVGDAELYKQFPDGTADGQRLYWVDWLASVSRAVQDQTTGDALYDNGEINERYGWISDYKMPAGSVQAENKLIAEADGISIPGTGGRNDAPGKLELGPFYCPESRYFVKVNGTQDGDTNDTENKERQRYSFALEMHDQGQGTSHSDDFKESLSFYNLQALFRNTCVVVHVTMRDTGDVDAYAEIQNWAYQEAFGTLSDT